MGASSVDLPSETVSRGLAKVEIKETTQSVTDWNGMVFAAHYDLVAQRVE